MSAAMQPELFVDRASMAEARAGIIRLEIPSGRSIVSFALTPNAASLLCEAMRRAVLVHYAAEGAAVIPFPAKVNRRKGKT